MSIKQQGPGFFIIIPTNAHTICTIVKFVHMVVHLLISHGMNGIEFVNVQQA
jgi:hypothetical protein